MLGVKALVIAVAAAVALAVVQIAFGEVIKQSRPDLYRRWTSKSGEAWRMAVLSALALLAAGGLTIAGVTTTGPNKSGFFVFAALVALGSAVAAIASIRLFRVARYS
jgi:hypothetical protein